MRKIFIASGIAVFLLYCWAATAYQNQVDVPAYREVEIDLLDGKTRDAWERDPQAQFQRLMELDTHGYQLPEGSGGEDGTTLAFDDFASRIARTPGQPVMMRLRDAREFTALLANNYVLRDTIVDPADAGGKLLYFGGRPLDKSMLDDLSRRGFKTIAVSGHSAPVDFQPGTAIMIMVIFFTLVAALKPVLWQPFTLMLEKRRRELEAGNEAERQSAQEAVRCEEEERRLGLELVRRGQELRLRGQREAAGEAEEIVRQARSREKEVKLAGLRDIGLAAGHARAEVGKMVPELAEAIAKAISPGSDGQ